MDYTQLAFLLCCSLHLIVLLRMTFNTGTLNTGFTKYCDCPEIPEAMGIYPLVIKDSKWAMPATFDYQMVWESPGPHGLAMPF